MENCKNNQIDQTSDKDNANNNMPIVILPTLSKDRLKSYTSFSFVNSESAFLACKGSLLSVDG